LHPQRPTLQCFLKGIPMSSSTTAALIPSVGIFTRLIASIDRLLAASARVSIRSGELPYFGL